MSLKEQFTYHFLTILRRILLRLSDRSAAALGRWIGAFAFRYLPVRREEAFSHLTRAFPHHGEIRRIRMLRRVYDHFGQILVDALRLGQTNVKRLVSVENRECLDRMLSKGKGVILLSGHLGNWEIIPAWLAQNGYKLYPVVKRQKNRGANRFFIELRRSTGSFPLYPTTPARQMLKILRDGNILGLVSDQDARRRGIFVDFFGIPSSTPKGAAVFHLKLNSPIAMGLCHRNADGSYHLKFEPILTARGDNDGVTAITQRFTSHLEHEIRNHPEQYFWFHRRWKTEPPA